MKNSSSNHRFPYYLLLSLVLLQGLSGLFGGAALTLDPTGETLQMPLTLLDGSPFNNYLIPGVILFGFLGLYPMIIFYGLISKQRWAWQGSMILAIALLIWIGVEIAMVGYIAEPPLQLVYGILGFLLLLLTPLSSAFGNETNDSINPEISLNQHE